MEVEVEVEVEVAVAVEVEVEVAVAVDVEVEVAVAVEVEVEVEVEVAVAVGLGKILSHGMTTMTMRVPHIRPAMTRMMLLITDCSFSMAFCWAGSPTGSGTSTTSGFSSVPA